MTYQIPPSSTCIRYQIPGCRIIPPCSIMYEIKDTSVQYTNMWTNWKTFIPMFADCDCAKSSLLSYIFDYCCPECAFLKIYRIVKIFAAVFYLLGGLKGNVKQLVASDITFHELQVLRCNFTEYLQYMTRHNWLCLICRTMSSVFWRIEVTTLKNLSKVCHISSWDIIKCEVLLKCNVSDQLLSLYYV